MAEKPYGGATSRDASTTPVETLQQQGFASSEVEGQNLPTRPLDTASKSKSNQSRSSHQTLQWHTLTDLTELADSLTFAQETPNHVCYGQ